MSRLLQKIDAVYALLAHGDSTAALTQARALMRAAPTDPEVLNLLRAVHEYRGEAEPALHFAKVATDVAPDDGDLCAQYGRVLCLRGQTAEGLRFLRSACELMPGREQPLSFLGSALISAGYLVQAEALLSQAVHNHPQHTGLLRHLAAAQLMLGHAETAALTQQRGQALAPDDTLLANEAAANCYGLPLDPAGQRRRAERFTALLARQFAGRGDQPLPAHPPFTGGRALRIGVVSSDLRNHSVSFFLKPMLHGLFAMGSELTGIIYDLAGTADEMNAALRAACSQGGWGWRDCRGMTDRDLAALMHDDTLDVLIDLNGLSAMAKPGVLLYRPARTQITYLGFPISTGFAPPHLHGRIVDEFTDPTPARSPLPRTDCQAWFTEPLIRLSDARGRPRPFLIFEPPASLPEAEAIGPPPALHDAEGMVTFGSFNTLQKLVDGCVALYAQVLATVPRSRLLLKAGALSDPETAEHTRNRLMRQGIAAERIIISPYIESYRDHFLLYNKLDIALDTFPYSGTTTTLEALCMGVPVVTLCPDNTPHQSRVSGSLLHASGHDELICQTPDQYVQVCAQLAADFARLSAYRHQLRADVLGSPLCDKASFAESMARTLRELALASA